MRRSSLGVSLPCALCLAAASPPLPERVEQLAWLAGSWVGDDGRGVWNDMSTAIALAKAGLGIAILPSSAALEGKQLRGLRSRPIRHEALTSKIGLIRRAGRSLSPAAERFADVLAGTARSFTR